jgi:acyl dehydratase
MHSAAFRQFPQTIIRCATTRSGGASMDTLLRTSSSGFYSTWRHAISTLYREVFIAFAERTCKFLKEVHSDDTLYPTLRIVGQEPEDTTGTIVTATAHNQRGELVLTGEHKYLLCLTRRSSRSGFVKQNKKGVG